MKSIIPALILSMVTISTEASPSVVYRSPGICLLGKSIEGIIVNPKKPVYRDGDTVRFSCRDGYRFNSRMPRNTTCHVTYIYNGTHTIHYSYVDGLGAFIPGISPDICVPTLVDIEGYCLYPIQEGLSYEKIRSSARIYDLGEKIKLACKDDYELTVHEIATCEADGFFSFTAIEGDRNMGGEFFKRFNQICSKKPICRAPTEHGVMVSPIKDYYTSGEAVTVSCGEYYDLVGSNTIVCGYRTGSRISDYLRRKHGYGEFNKAYKCRRKPTCDRPDIAGLKLTPLQQYYEIGQKVNVSCYDGHEHDFEFTMITCRRTNVNRANFDRSFSDQPCTLIFGCKAPPPQPGLILHPMKDEYNVSDTVEIHCEEGYELRGSKTASCVIQKGGRKIRRHDLSSFNHLYLIITSINFHPQLGTCENNAAVANEG